MTTYNLALIGFGGVNRALAELIREELPGHNPLHHPGTVCDVYRDHHPVQDSARGGRRGRDVPRRIRPSALTWRRSTGVE